MAAFADIHLCQGCDHCGMSGPCIHKDDMRSVLPKLLAWDMVVRATQLYYFGISAQLKIAIDCFYSPNGKIQAKQLDAVLLATAWDQEPHIVEGLKRHYEIICNYLDWSNRGVLLGLGCGTVAMTKRTDYPEQAYRMGLSIA